MRYTAKCIAIPELLDEKELAYQFVGPCIVTGILQSVTVTLDELIALHKGVHIQDALVRLTPAEREFLMSGISGDAFGKLFG